MWSPGFVFLLHAVSHSSTEPIMQIIDSSHFLSRTFCTISGCKILFGTTFLFYLFNPFSLIIYVVFEAFFYTLTFSMPFNACRVWFDLFSCCFFNFFEYCIVWPQNELSCSFIPWEIQNCLQYFAPSICLGVELWTLTCLGTASWLFSDWWAIEMASLKWFLLASLL